MPPRFGETATPAGATKAPVTTQQTVAPARPPEASYRPRQAPAGRDDEDGLAPPTGDEADGGGGGGRWPRREDFGPLASGDHTFVCNVSAVVRWHFGVVVTFRVLLGDERGREVDWNQSPPKGMSDKFLAFWRRTFFGAYAAGGWTVDAEPSRKWDGWEASSKAGADGKPLPLPPYDRFFVLPASPDGSVPAVPLAVEVDVRVDPPPHDKYPKIVAVRLAHDANGSVVQAPIPFKVIDWVAERNGWVGVTDDKIGASGHTRAPVLKLDSRQVPKDAAGLRWYAEALRSHPSAKPQARPAAGPISPSGGWDSDIPF